MVLGSATPSVDSYERSREEGLYQLYELPLRVENRAMPGTEVVDLREELRMGNRSIFSARLKELMEDRLRKGEQIMLFLNRQRLCGLCFLQSLRTCDKMSTL